MPSARQLTAQPAYDDRSSGAAMKAAIFTASPAGVRHPEDQTALEDITPHRQLGILPPQPHQLGPLILAQLPSPPSRRRRSSSTQFPRCPR